MGSGPDIKVLCQNLNILELLKTEFKATYSSRQVTPSGQAAGRQTSNVGFQLRRPTIGPGRS